MGLVRTLALTAGLTAATFSTAAAQKTLKVVMHSDLKIIDPIWSSAYIVRQHGYLIYDTLFALDEKLAVKPQMAEGFTVSADKLTYTIKLRDGLAWHDGQPVTAEDCIASIKRWTVRDAVGAKLASFVKEYRAADTKTIEIVLKDPFGQVIEALAKPSGVTPFMMPKRVAETDPFKQIEDTTGSGPYVMKKDEWKPGDKVVYVKNPNYKPRTEPTSGLAGAKIATLDRIEWLHMPDPQTQVNALLTGEIDQIESLAHDLLPVVEKDKGVKLVPQLGGLQYTFRMNWLIPPFNNIKVRQAAQMALGQQDFLQAAVGDARYFKTCKALFTCGTTYASDIGMDGLIEGNAAKAKALLKDSGYDGTPVAILSPSDVAVLKNLGPVAKAQLEAAGFKVDLLTMDWQTMVGRLSKKTAASEGGWHAFSTAWQQIDILDPLMQPFLAAIGDKGRPGWPLDDEMERLRDAFARESDPATKKALADQAQLHNSKIVTHIPLGEWRTAMAMRLNITPHPTAPFAVFWGMDKK